MQQADLFSHAPVIERGYIQPTKLQAARARGEEAAQACADKAERTTDFDAEAARAFVLAYLAKHGVSSGELVTGAAVLAGHRPHDQRAFGQVYKRLLRDKQIKRVGECARVRGHGSRGGSLYALEVA